MHVRLDFFLKTSRLLKRRTTAREMCDHGRVLVNGRGAKPGKEVKPGDIIVLNFSSKIIEVQVAAIPAHSGRKTGPLELYTVLSEKRTQRDNDLWSENH